MLDETTRLLLESLLATNPYYPKEGIKGGGG